MKNCKTEKVRYTTRNKAWSASIDFKQIKDLEMGVYKCKFCQGYHLTRQLKFQPTKHALKNIRHEVI